MDTWWFYFTYTGHTQDTPHIQSSTARYIIINRDEIKAFFGMNKFIFQGISVTA